MIEKAMTEAGYSVKQNKNAKSQVSQRRELPISLMLIRLNLGVRMHKDPPKRLESPNSKSAHAH